MSAARKLPVIDELSGFFWTSGADGRLRILRCGPCSHWQHPPQPRCAKCHSADLAPQPVSGRGRVVSFTVNYQSWQKDVAALFIFAVIELAEQAELYVFSNLTCAPEAARSDMAVEVIFEQQEDVWIPLFQPLGADHA